MYSFCCVLFSKLLCKYVKKSKLFFQSREHRLKQELEQSQRQCEWLNSEIRDINSQLLMLRKDKVGKVYSLNAVDLKFLTLESVS